ncbi:hypothetical protein HN011_004122 [Eciton burchellii]|nr:hypothetical protein HN011_004122 [Eciton burchellii]
MSVDETTSREISTEARKVIVQHVDCTREWELPHRYSSWTRLVRITAYALRFIGHLRRGRGSQPRRGTPLEVAELRDAAHQWFQLVQKAYFSKEWGALNKNESIPSSSSLKALRSMLRDDSLLRLDGRLHNAALEYGTSSHSSWWLLAYAAHRKEYWIIGSRGLIKKHIHSCVICTRQAARLSMQLMGNLPGPRVSPSSPFSHTGVDYTEPFGILPFVGRGQRARKHYIVLFICLVTKAIHLEIVEDYTTAGFLAAFRRFVSRRGLPAHIYSDNGPNFHSADRELQTSFQAMRTDLALQAGLTNDGVQWHFIPPVVAHFGGLWEAEVKSLKFHLRRVIGARTLSKAEFATLLCQIEACLNSRPIAPLTDDPADLSALMPGHFLIGRPLVAAPEDSVLEINANRLSRWQLVQALQEQIWRSWSKDYLHSLQVRSKWSKQHPDLEVGDLVILRNPQLPLSHWELAQIVQVHPGADGHLRVVTVRTAKTQYKRPITQICKLPVMTGNDALESKAP